MTQTTKGSGSLEIPSIAKNLVSKLKRRQVFGSWHVATETLVVLRQIISNSKWNSVYSLLGDITTIGNHLVKAQPQELAVGNIVRRVLHMIREEYKIYCKEMDGDIEVEATDAKATPSMFNLMMLADDIDDTIRPDETRSVYTFKPTVIQAVTDMLDELVNIYSNISMQSLEHIHNNEIVMTLGKSRTVEEFLKVAARKRKFQVIVVETLAKEDSISTAKSLANSGISATILPQAAVFAVMSRVNKVILGTHAVLANGGVIAVSGSQSIAAAAKAHATPIVVCAGLYKLSPLFPTDIDLLNLCTAPSSLADYSDGELIANHVEVVTPYFDYVAPELVSLFITNSGGHTPSYLYRLINENYDFIDQGLGTSSLPANK